MPNLPLLISGRYLFAKKSHNAINLITGISAMVLALGTTAMILILSVFNGLEDLIADLYNTVKPDIEIKPATGKYLNIDSVSPILNQYPEIAQWSQVLEDMAMAKYTAYSDNERQLVVKIKAVEENYNRVTGVDTMIYEGRFLLEYQNNYFAVPGYGVAARLDLRLNNPETPLFFYYPRAEAHHTDLLNAFNIEPTTPSGIISLQQEDDDQLVYVSLHFAQKLMNLPVTSASSLELKVRPNTNPVKLAEELKTILGKGYEVRHRLQLNETLYKITRSEKWSGFLILSFILLLAAFNLVGSVTVLILEKKHDISIFEYLGFTKTTIKKIFLYEGLFISFIGGLSGLFIGSLLVLLQQHFGLIPMEGNFAISHFPVALRLTDFLYVFLLVIIIGFLSTWIPVNRLNKLI